MTGSLNSAAASAQFAVPRGRNLNFTLTGTNFVGTVALEISRTNGAAWEPAARGSSPFSYTGSLHGSIADETITNESNGLLFYRVRVVSYTSGSVDYEMLGSADDEIIETLLRDASDNPRILGRVDGGIGVVGAVKAANIDPDS